MYSPRRMTELPSGAMFPPYLIHHKQFFPPTLPGGKCYFLAPIAILAIVLEKQGTQPMNLESLLVIDNKFIGSQQGGTDANAFRHLFEGFKHFSGRLISTSP